MLPTTVQLLPDAGSWLRWLLIGWIGLVVLVFGFFSLNTVLLEVRGAIGGKPKLVAGLVVGTAPPKETEVTDPTDPLELATDLELRLTVVEAFEVGEDGQRAALDWQEAKLRVPRLRILDDVHIGDPLVLVCAPGGRVLFRYRGGGSV